MIDATPLLRLFARHQSRQLAQALDARLCAANDDYRAHRAGWFGMAPPQVLPAPPGTFTDWMRARGKLGGQRKVPRIVRDPALFRSLRRSAERR